MRQNSQVPASKLTLPLWPVAGWGLEAQLMRWEEAALKHEGLACFPVVVLMDRDTKGLGLVVISVKAIPVNKEN